MEHEEITVLGCGVSGLTCAVRLLEEGHGVRLVTRELPFRATSAVAPAIWHPYRVEPEERILPWAKRTLETFYRLARDPDTGVSTLLLDELFGEPREPRWLSLVRRCRPLEPEELAGRLAEGVDPGLFPSAYEVELPRIETPVYLPWLLSRFKRLGGELEVRPEGISDLSELTAPDRPLVNCTGLGAGELLDDREVFPIRGQLLRVANPGIERGVADEEGPLSVAYVIPRDRDVILGGTAERGGWDTAPDPEVSSGIRDRTGALDPRIAAAPLIEVKVGLRPGRTEVRLEREELPDGSVVIHDYGHGGAGYTLSWGCAEEVVRLLGEGG